jgi:hypothetical protein
VAYAIDDETSSDIWTYERWHLVGRISESVPDDSNPIVMTARASSVFAALRGLRT